MKVSKIKKTDNRKVKFIAGMFLIFVFAILLIAVNRSTNLRSKAAGICEICYKNPNASVCTDGTCTLKYEVQKKIIQPLRLKQQMEIKKKPAEQKSGGGAKRR